MDFECNQIKRFLDNTNELCRAFEEWERGMRRNIFQEKKHAVVFNGADKYNALKALEDSEVLSKITVGLRDSDALKVAQARCLIEHLVEGVYIGTPKGSGGIRRGDVTVMWDSEQLKSPGLGVVYRIDDIHAYGSFHQGRLFIFWLKIPVRRPRGYRHALNVRSRCSSFHQFSNTGYSRLFSEGKLLIGKTKENICALSFYDVIRHDSPVMLKMFRECSALVVLIENGWKISEVDQTKSGLGFDDGMQLIKIAEEMVHSECCKDIVCMVLEAGANLALRSFRTYTQKEAKNLPRLTPLERFGSILKRSRSEYFGFWPVLCDKIVLGLNQYFSVEEGRNVINMSGVRGWEYAGAELGWRYERMEEKHDVMRWVAVSMTHRDRSLFLTNECTDCINKNSSRWRNDLVAPKVLRHQIENLTYLLLYNLNSLKAQLSRRNFIFDTMKPAVTEKGLRVKGKEMVNEIYDTWKNCSAILNNFNKLEYRRRYKEWKRTERFSNSIRYVPLEEGVDEEMEWNASIGQDCYKLPPKRKRMKRVRKRKASH